MRTTRGTRLHSLYADAVKGHRLCSVRDLDPVRVWNLGTAGTSAYFAEVAILYGGKRLLVHGDVDEVLLWGFAPPDRGHWPPDDLAILRWAAHSQAAYLSQKALFPKGGEWDHNIAIADLEQMLRDARENLTYPEYPDYAHALDTLLDHLRSDRLGHEWLMHAAADAGIDTEDVGGVGMCVHHGIIMAQEVLCKLLALLGEEK